MNVPADLDAQATISEKASPGGKAGRHGADLLFDNNYTSMSPDGDSLQGGSDKNTDSGRRH